MIVLLGGIIGADMAPDPSWATLPLAVMITGGAVFSIPAALLMQKIGRRPGFFAGALVAALASIGAAYSITIHNFSLFCLSSLCIGTNMAFVQQYRFAAAESVDQVYVGRAVSYVLVGGIIAAFLGPELAMAGKNWLPQSPYTGSFAALAMVYSTSALLISFLHLPLAKKHKESGLERPLTEIVTQPLFIQRSSPDW